MTEGSTIPTEEPDWDDAGTVKDIVVFQRAVTDDGSPTKRFPLPRRFAHLGVSAALVFSSPSMTFPSYFRRDDEFLESRVQVPPDESSRVCARRVSRALVRADSETYEDGIVSQLERDLEDCLATDPRLAVRTIVELIAGGGMPAEPSGAAIRWLSTVPSESTFAQRLWLAEHALFSSNSLVRDSGLIAISNLDDPAAINSIEKAREVERVPTLRVEMDNTIRDLRRHENAVPPTEDSKS